MDNVGLVREKTDIVSLISEYLPLKKAGRNFKANCPFHSEKTPSFVVSPERQIWHCFGCQKGGDAFTFLMEYEHLEFPEALRMLAKKAGVTLAEFAFDSATSSKKERIYGLNHLAMEFYHYLLIKHNVGKKALSYLKDRGVNSGSINTFMLGFAPSLSDSLTVYLTQKKTYKKEDVVDAGLGFYKGSRVVDFFQGRLMFPLVDHRGNIVGFSGRSLFDTKISKYVNTRQTLVYQKGTHFFGINIAKDAIKSQGRAIVVEGEFDVISLFQEGFRNTIGIKGSALTQEQAALLARFSPKVTLCFDKDSAGQLAILKSVPVLEQKGLTITVVDYKEAKDPDEAIKKDPIAFKKFLKDDKGVYDYIIAQMLHKYDPKSFEGKKKIGDEVLPLVSEIENELVKEHYLKKLSAELDVSFESIVRQVEKMKSKERMEKPSLVINTSAKRTREEILEEYLLGLLIQCHFVKDVVQDVYMLFKERGFQLPAYKKLLEQLVLSCEHDGVFDHAKFSKNLPHELFSMYNTVYLLPIPAFKNDGLYKEEIQKVGKELLKLSLKNEIKKLGEKIKETERDGNSKDLEKLRLELVNLVGLLKKA